MKYGVLVYGDQEFFCTLLGSFLREHGFNVVKELVNIWEVIAEIPKSKPDIVLLDARRSRSNGIEDTSIIKGEFPEQKIAILSASKEIVDIIAAIDAGVVGYILKSSLSNEVLSDLYAICRGEVRISHELAGEVIKTWYSQRSRELLKEYSTPLTHREKEILVLLSQGKSNKEIAAQLLLSPNTIKNHILSIFNKLDVHSRAGAVSKWKTLITNERRRFSPEKIPNKGNGQLGSEI
jgi:two-component system nitrate/nitrite response regulator NarL